MKQRAERSSRCARFRSRRSHHAGDEEVGTRTRRTENGIRTATLHPRMIKLDWISNQRLPLAWAHNQSAGFTFGLRVTKWTFYEELGGTTELPPSKAAESSREMNLSLRHTAAPKRRVELSLWRTASWVYGLAFCCTRCREPRLRPLKPQSDIAEHTLTMSFEAHGLSGGGVNERRGRKRGNIALTEGVAQISHACRRRRAATTAQQSHGFRQCLLRKELLPRSSEVLSLKFNVTNR